MADKRKDGKGRNLRTGEYYDPQNQRYMFRKMVEGERVTITAANLVDLRKQENELLCKIDKGARFNTGNAKKTLNEYFDYWFAEFAKSGRKATTCTNYKSYYNTYIRNTIGKKQLTKITKLDCQKIINKMTEDGKKHSTMANLKSCLNIVFECAVDDDILIKNPAKNLQIPQTECKKRTAIEQNQIEVFMDYVKNSRQYSYLYPAFVVLFNSGMRVGEMASLTWEDIDFQENTISVNKTVNRYRKADYGFTVAVASPKSKTSVRVVTMNHTTRLVLLKLKMQNVSPAAKLPYVDDSGHIRRYVTGFVFGNSMGNVWTEPAFRDVINRIIEHYNREAGKNGQEPLENFCPHMTRHTYTTLAYSAGADAKIVSEILGHASTAITLDTYTHLTDEKKRQQEELMKLVNIL